MFLAIGNDLYHFQLKVIIAVITQGFSFICFRTVEACTPY